MRNTRRDMMKSAALALGLAVGADGVVFAQDMTGGAGLSSGTGSGTGAGGFSGVVRNRSGSISGSGPGSLSGLRGGVDRMRLGPRTGSVTFGPGVDVSFPDDPYLMPFLLPEQVANPIEGKTATKVTQSLLENARRIVDPAERSLALRQIANGAIASGQLVLAHRLLEEAITATSNVNVPLVRDQRLIGLVTSLTALSDALLRTGRESLGMLPPALEAEVAQSDPLPKRPETTVLVRLARLEWRRADYLASIIGNATYRNEMLYRVAENEASGSASLANDFFRPADIDSPGNRPATVPPPPPTPVPAEPGPAAPAAPPSQAPDAREKDAYLKLADEILVDAWGVAERIDRLIWKNRAMVRITLSASDSRQYSRMAKLTQTIQNAESRTEALLILAEAQCRNGQEAAGTSTYQAAAESAAAITQDGLRGVMVGFLIDSMIAAGRFDDARACTTLYPEESERFVALGAVAESMGRRGLGDAARRWIAADMPPGYRSALYRRVSAGVLWSVEQSRSKELPMGEPVPGR